MLTATVPAEELEKMKVYPVHTLERIAMSERHELVRKVLRSVMLKPEIKPDYAIRVFKAMRKSPHISDIEKKSLDFCEARKIGEIGSPYVPCASQPAPN